jgi:hypothetical protein
MLVSISLLIFVFHYICNNYYFTVSDVIVVANVCAVVALAAADAFNVVANVVVYVIACIHFSQNFCFHFLFLVLLLLLLLLQMFSILLLSRLAVAVTRTLYVTPCYYVRDILY